MCSNVCCLCCTAWYCMGCVGYLRSLWLFDTPDWMHYFTRKMQYVPLNRDDIEMGSLEPLVEPVPVKEMKTVLDAAVKGSGEAIYAHLPDL